MITDETTGISAALTERLERIRQIEPPGHESLLQALPALQRVVRDAATLEAMISLCEEVALSARGQLPCLTGSLVYLLDRLNVSGLRRWILTGMRLYPDDGVRLGGYFRLEDPIAVSSLRAESDGASLAGVRTSLQYFLAGFGLAEMEVRPRKQQTLDALPGRPVISDQVLLLPEHYLALEGALEGAIYAAATAHAIAHLRHSVLHQTANKRKPLLLAVLSLIEDARVERIMGQQYPGLYALWGKFHTATGAKNDLTVGSLTARLARAIHDPCYEDPNHWVNKGRELFEQCAGRLHDLAAFNEVGSILANDLGQMRVRFVAQQYSPEPAYRDDNTVLWDFGSESQEALDDEILARNTMQIVPDETQADEVARISPVMSSDEQRVHYPEWDYRTEMLRENWVTVIDVPVPRAVQHQTSQSAERAVSRHSTFGSKVHLLDRGLRLRRQHEGEELDIDAAIESRISFRGRIMPDPRVFQRAGRRRRHLTVLLLLDLSESTNDRIGGSFTSVLDLEKQAADILAVAIDPGYDRFAIGGFASNGRSNVRYTHIKDFDQPYGDVQRHYLRQQRGALSTRMGAALRHAGARLAADHAEKKVLLVVTDGEPSDIDVVDKAYLVEDARHAVAGLNIRGIDTFCLTLDKRADSYVRTIFGAWNFQIVDNAISLPFQVSQALAKVAAR
ncbi:nitric oxide reductase activation protein NorD [Glaciimonas immobilis]|uniref:VWFA domain-containing protein n=1 Tax=Glaciimonas immobilis TaxID=728004 RepID=A0A840RUS8_9BURK|nr:VWA domain-containing protein [Glaciimonas immobilis]KAF3999867.1 VWA domain-containing protein [Glaciimonas immobilis]MBB5200351.1 hypothetical protein [Glaciimonas immobilis]